MGVQAGPLAVVAGILVAGGLVAAMVVTRRGQEGDAALGAAREAATAEAARAGEAGALPPGPSGGTSPDLAAALTRIAETLDRIERALAREGRTGTDGTAVGDPRARDGADAGGNAVEPWYRRSGAVLDWLPPDGFSLAKGWYREEMTGRLAAAQGAPAAHEAAIEERLAKLRPLAGIDTDEGRLAKEVLARLEAMRDSDRKSGEQQLADARRRLEALDAVATEIELAKWMDEFSVTPPKRWQLAEFAAKRAGK